MQITNISYSKTFPLAAYTNEKISLDAQLDEHDDPITAMATLKEKVEELHKKNNPQLWDSNEFKQYVDSGLNPHYTKEKHSATITINPPFTEESTPTSVKQTLAEQILTCNDIKVLHSYKLLIQKDADAKAAYEKMEKKLNKEPINIPTHENR